MKKSLKLDLWLKQFALLHLGEYNYFPLFHHSWFKSEWFYGMFFQNCIYSLFQATCANLCESMERYGAVTVYKIANKNKFAKTVSYR